jgi:hypothetical protein
MAPAPEWMIRANFVGAELLDGAGNGFDRALHVALDQQRELLAAGSCSWVIICSSEPRARSGGGRLVAGKRWRYSAISRARASFSTTAKRSPACGVP